MRLIYYILFAFTLIYWMYFVVTGMWAFKSKKKHKNHSAKNKFAIIVAGRNEETVIGDLIDSLKMQDYKKELYEIYVMPNNCNDNTASVARAHGANIISSRKKINNKADALRICFDKLKSRKDIDAYIVFDADNIVHPNFLKEMNNVICEGYSVAQGFRDSKNMGDNWLTGSYTLYYYLQNFFFNRARKMLNASATINGTGFMIKKSVIDEIGFNTKTLTEDVEFTAICAINNIKVAFAEKAITYDEHPLDFKSSWKQRKRWTSGNLSCFGLYYKDLLKSFFRNQNLASLDMFLTFQAAFIQVLSFFLTIILVMFRIFNVELTDFFSYMFNNPILFTVIFYLLTVFIGMFVVKYNGKSIGKIISGLLLFSVFLITWIPINIVCLFKKTNSWEYIKHSRRTNIKELIN